MYKEVPIQNRIIQRKVDEQENHRQAVALRDVKNSINDRWNDVSRVSTAPGPSRKNQIAYARFVEIERQNRILLNKMGRIAQNDYRSAFKESVS